MLHHSTESQMLHHSTEPQLRQRQQQQQQQYWAPQTTALGTTAPNNSTGHGTYDTALDTTGHWALGSGHLFCKASSCDRCCCCCAAWPSIVASCTATCSLSCRASPLASINSDADSFSFLLFISADFFIRTRLFSFSANCNDQQQPSVGQQQQQLRSAARVSIAAR